MATEAQRLMVLSLGKIQGCRQQRGGINLYRSLLVTKVLYHARSVALSEHAVQKKEEPSEDQIVPEMTMQEDTTHVDDQDQQQYDEIDSEKKDTVVEDNSDYDLCDKENVHPVNSSKPQNYPVNTPEDFQESPKDQSIDRCSRCVKRRMTEVEEAVESISPKKQKLEENCDYRATEPMQVEQISSLVNRFSSGFTGLLATECDNVPDSDQEESDSEVQGHSDSSLLSCSTQIKESFELLARPIALSV